MSFLNDGANTSRGDSEATDLKRSVHETIQSFGAEPGVDVPLTGCNHSIGSPQTRQGFQYVTKANDLLQIPIA